MTNNDNILDELFRSKLNDFEEVPPSYVWMKIQEKQKVGKRNRVLYAMRMGGIAAALLLAFLLGWQLQEHRNLLKKVPVVAEKEQQEDQVPEQNQSKEGDPSSTAVQEPVIPEKHRSFFVEKKVTANTVNQEDIQNQRDVPAPNQSLAFLAMANVKIETPEVIRELKRKRADDRKDEPILTEEDRMIIEMNQRFQARIPDAKRDNSWSIGAQVSPAYSVNNASYNETYASNMSRPAEKQSINLGGGISIKYEKGKRWSVQSGLQYNRLNQSTGSSGSRQSDVMNAPSNTELGYTYFNNKVHREPTGQLVMNGSAGVIEIEQLPSSVRVSASLESTEGNQLLLTSDDFEQHFEYLEVPLFVRYNLIDREWNMHMLGGVSANMLVGNDVFIKNGDGDSYIGKTKDMSRLNYSASFGFGMGYRLTDKLQLNIEPQLKYYLRSLNNNPDINFKPYSIGIYTGVSYRF